MIFAWIFSAFAFSSAPNFEQETLSPSEKTWNLSADALFWYASQETSSTWATDFSAHIQEDCFSLKFCEKDASLGWAPGFRIGVGGFLPFDDWDTQFKWLWFQKTSCNQIRESTHIILPEFFCGFMVGDIADSGKVTWDFSLNMFDWELGRQHPISPSLFFRPFLGIKGGWIDQSIHSKWHVIARQENGSITTENFTSKENVKNNFWGVGPSGGVNTWWSLGHSSAFSLLGDVSLATLFGNWSFKDKYNNPLPQKITTDLNDSSLGALMFRSFLGIGAKKKIGKTHLSANLGYEMQIWFNQVRIPTYQQLCVRGDLTLQGATLNCLCEF